MTDTTRPTVEALIAVLKEVAGQEEDWPTLLETADVLSALLTERDDANTRIENLLGEQVAGIGFMQIAEALAEFKAPIDYYDDDVQRAHAILSRGAQDAAEPHV